MKKILMTPGYIYSTGRTVKFIYHEAEGYHIFIYSLIWNDNDLNGDSCLVETALADKDLLKSKPDAHRFRKTDSCTGGFKNTDA